jgi:hypothetical protein
VLTARVSSPENTTIWSVYETPGDFIRVVVGLIACLWILVDVSCCSYQTYTYLGLAAVPFALICLVAVW